MSAAVPRYLSAASSDQGLVRPNNEDRVYCDDSRGFFVVIDGMGGHEAGEVAAEIATQRMRARLERETDSVEQRLREAITLANNAIFEAAKERPAWKGMACVLTAAVIENGDVTVGHVGDSRLYRIKRGIIEKLTHDHSPVGEREDSGELTERAAMQHPRRNEVYRDVGSQEHTPDDEGFIEILKFPFALDSALLLCSDGLSDALSSEQILSIVEQHVGNRWSTVQALITAASETSRDNVSVVWVEGEGFADSFAGRSARETAAVAGGTILGEARDREAVFQAKTPWYRRGAAYLLYGTLLGGALMFGIENFLIPKLAPHTAQLLIVKFPGTIRDAVQAAQEGDTVRVGPGNYSETITLKEGVNLVAEPAGQAVIEQGVTADNLRYARLEGFQVRGGDIGIRVKNSVLTLTRNDIAGANGAGVEFSGDSGGVIFGCAIHNNTGSGITVADSASPAIQNNVIVENGKSPNALRPGLSVHSSGKPIISGNIFADNGAEPIWLPASDESLLQHNSFSLSGTADQKVKFKIVPLGDGRP